jgi:hypothetical protein
MNGVNKSMKAQLSNERILELAEQAYKNNEIAEFLSGVGEYENPIDRFTPANVPTDCGRSIEKGLYDLYSKTKDDGIVDATKKAIEKLLNGTAIQVWCAYSACWSFGYKEKDERAPFHIITSGIEMTELVDLVKLALEKNKEELKNNFEYQGWNQKEGLWDDILRTNSVIKEYGISFI